MKKPNQFRSSNFYMETGDILHMRFKGETGTTPTIVVNVENPDGTTNEETVPGQGIALDATDITSSGFTANWNFIVNATGYYLDVATDSAFTSPVVGYDSLNVGSVNAYDVVGLDDLTDYYWKITPYNDYGSGTASAIEELTTTMEEVLDGDGNVYTYVTIGTQQWLVENLKTTKYIDGTAIQNLTVDGDWITDTTGAYCWYNNDISNKPIYGALYNWYAVDNIHGLAPTGWRIPTISDIVSLANAIGGTGVAGGKLKEGGTTHWSSPNTGATNETGFTGLPGGERTYSTGAFGFKGEACYLLVSDSVNVTDCRGAYLYYSSDDLLGTATTTNKKKTGRTIRCVRDI